MKLTKEQQNAYEKLFEFKEAYPMDYLGYLPSHTSLFSYTDVLLNSPEIVHFSDGIEITSSYEKKFLKRIDTFGINSEIDEFLYNFIHIMKACEMITKQNQILIPDEIIDDVYSHDLVLSTEIISGVPKVTLINAKEILKGRSNVR